MSFIKYISLPVLLICITSNAHATLFYKHIPCTLTMQTNDTLIVNYDLTEHVNVHCASSEKNVYIYFSYKGNEKNNYLPVTLLNDHLPNKKSEHLADTMGQFTISMQTSANTQHTYTVNCEYMN